MSWLLISPPSVLGQRTLSIILAQMSKRKVKPWGCPIFSDSGHRDMLEARTEGYWRDAYNPERRVGTLWHTRAELGFATDTEYGPLRTNTVIRTERFLQYRKLPLCGPSTLSLGTR